MVNSKRKGKTGELEAVQFLKSLGFADARRTQQYNGVAGDADVSCPDSLPGLHIEVKFGYPLTVLDLDNEKFAAVVWKAAGSAAVWCVLWKPARKNKGAWRLTYLAGSPLVVSTVYGREAAVVLRWLAEKL